jgi:hypothetical protein
LPHRIPFRRNRPGNLPGPAAKSHVAAKHGLFAMQLQSATVSQSGHPQFQRHFDPVF